MKKIQIPLAVALLVVCGATFAYTAKQKPKAGYVGLQLGYGNTHYTREDIADYFEYALSSGVKSTGFAGRLYGGYDFNEYFSLEAGFTFLPKVKFHDVDGFSGLDLSFNQNIVDLLAKATLPLKYNIDLYGKAGIADVLKNNYEFSAAGQELRCDDQYTQVVPVLGAGVDYGFNDHVFADVSYMRYFGGGNGSSHVKPSDFFGVGVAYRS